jgi:hypothetical protein
MAAPLDEQRHDEREDDSLADGIRQAMAEEGLTHYHMSLVGDDIEAVVNAVNVGIDARLTACNCPERGDSYQHGDRSITATFDTKHWKAGKRLRLARTFECRVSAESLPVLLRRLDDNGSEAAWNLRGAILSTLGIKE